MRHVPMLLFLILYVLVIGQNWAHYAAAFMIDKRKILSDPPYTQTI